MDDLTPDIQFLGGRFGFESGDQTVVLDQALSDTLEEMRLATTRLMQLLAQKPWSGVWEDMIYLNHGWKIGETVPDWALVGSLQLYSHEHLNCTDVARHWDLSTDVAFRETWRECTAKKPTFPIYVLIF